MNKHPVWTEINLNAISHNLKEIRNWLSPSTKIMAVVKGNAYGHGSIKTALRLVKNKIDYFGVSRPNEALELRIAGVNIPILIFGYTPIEFIKEAIEQNITLTVYDFKTAKSISNVAISLNKKIKVHIEIDTGMGRLGIFIPLIEDQKLYINTLNKVLDEVENITKLDGLITEGIYTHFAVADSFDYKYSTKQLNIFNDFIYRLSLRKIIIPIIHSANSAAMLNFNNSHMNMVRAGICLYGILPSCCMNRQINLQSAMTIKALVAHVKNVPRGTRISYSSIYTTTKKTRIATIPIGYADGYRWQKKPNGFVLIHGQQAPIIGRICMDFFMVDVGHIENVQPSDEVVVLGKQKNQVITANTLAINSNTISYEIISSLTARMPRIYV
ncbi:MAG: alanine racemase [bacterium]|nr:alanine racemase [bacterium]